MLFLRRHVMSAMNALTPRTLSHSAKRFFRCRTLPEALRVLFKLDE